MNVMGLLIFTIFLIFNLFMFWEIWFYPDRFMSRMKAYRKSYRNFLGFSYWQEDKLNFPLVKIMNMFLLLISIIGVVVSITGPIVY